MTTMLMLFKVSELSDAEKNKQTNPIGILSLLLFFVLRETRLMKNKTTNCAANLSSAGRRLMRRRRFNPGL